MVLISIKLYPSAIFPSLAFLLGSVSPCSKPVRAASSGSQKTPIFSLPTAEDGEKCIICMTEPCMPLPPPVLLCPEGLKRAWCQLKFVLFLGTGISQPYVCQLGMSLFCFCCSTSRRTRFKSSGHAIECRSLRGLRQPLVFHRLQWLAWLGLTQRNSTIPMPNFGSMLEMSCIGLNVSHKYLRRFRPSPIS
jgi:hypothetical protein